MGDAATAPGARNGAGRGPWHVVGTERESSWNVPENRGVRGAVWKGTAPTRCPARPGRLAEALRQVRSEPPPDQDEARAVLPAVGNDRGPERVRGDRPGTFNLLGFTHYWSRSLRGSWVIKLKTAADRFSRAVRSIDSW